MKFSNNGNRNEKINRIELIKTKYGTINKKLKNKFDAEARNRLSSRLNEQRKKHITLDTFAKKQREKEIWKD